MHIDRIGFTPLKGGRHRSHPDVELAATGPVGDRLFCLVDPARRRVARTVENRQLLSTAVTWRDDVLSVEIAGDLLEGRPSRSGRQVEAEYWGRPAVLDVMEGPWAAAYSKLLGYDVVLARSTTPGDVVYADPVTLVTTSSLRDLSERVGTDVAVERFRATFTVQTDDLPAYAEDGWEGCELQLGDARIRVLGGIPRCAVIDMDPLTGITDASLLKALADYRRVNDAIEFGVYAVVTEPARIRRADLVEIVGG